MTTTFTPTARPSRPTTLHRVGYTLAALGNGLALWIVHQFLDWGWPSFLTAEFAEVLPVLSASLIAGILINAMLMQTNRPPFRVFTDLVNAGFGLAVAWRAWTVFPFDFNRWETDWSWAVRVMLIVGIVGTIIGILVNLLKLVGILPVTEPD